MRPQRRGGTEPWRQRFPVLKWKRRQRHCQTARRRGLTFSLSGAAGPGVTTPRYYSEPTGRERDAWRLALCHSGADLLGAGRNACLQMVLEIRRVRCNRGEFLRLSSRSHPRCGVYLVLALRREFGQIVPVILMIAGTIVAASASRVLYQIALSVTGADNGFVTMFFLLIPALTALISLPLSWWIADLHFAVSLMFYVGLVVVSASLLFFSLKSWGQPDRQ
jgi:hypothetical protein